jgi:hypothetical protein
MNSPDTYIKNIDSLRKDIRDGKVQHVGYTKDKKPLYRQVHD